VGEGVARHAEAAQPALPEGEAQGHVAATEGEFLVEAAHALEVVTPDGDAGGGDGEDVPVPGAGAKQGGRTGAQPREEVAREAGEPEDHAAMLDPALGIDELDAHRAHLGDRRPAHQLLEPAGISGDPDVVVEEEQHPPGGRSRTGVVDR